MNSSFWSEAECVSKFISRCAVSVNVTTAPRGPSPGPSESSLQRQGRQFLLCSRTMEPLCDGPALHLEVFWRFKWLWRQQLLITCDYIFSSMKLLILVGIAHLDAISAVSWKCGALVTVLALRLSTAPLWLCLNEQFNLLSQSKKLPPCT